MKIATFLILDQYAEWEATYLSATLSKSDEWEIRTISTHQQVRSIGGFNTLVDYTLENDPGDEALLVLVGGDSWNIEDPTVTEKVKDAFDKGIAIGAICGAVDYLARYGFLNQYIHTGNDQSLWSNYVNYQPDKHFVSQQSVADGNLVTANGTAALSFTQKVLQLVNFDTTENIEKLTYLYQNGFYRYCEKYGNPYM
ncbi:MULTISPECIES: DJ-1/PfpI family protein [Staphylococcus]|uniref:DJ-1/PfpI family protein n=1 Tax=Staphylococcus hsinchuensis TaxID=3051183 RepID=A0ABZ3EBT6_9STAP|nr:MULTISPECIES: DJ-1/PfpI family protein [unclassified Staphylococcus]